MGKVLDFTENRATDGRAEITKLNVKKSHGNGDLIDYDVVFSFKAEDEATVEVVNRLVPGALGLYIGIEDAKVEAQGDEDMKVARPKLSVKPQNLEPFKLTANIANDDSGGKQVFKDAEAELLSVDFQSGEKSTVANYKIRLLAQKPELATELVRAIGKALDLKADLTKAQGSLFDQPADTKPADTATASDQGEPAEFGADEDEDEDEGVDLEGLTTDDLIGYETDGGKGWGLVSGLGEGIVKVTNISGTDDETEVSTDKITSVLRICGPAGGSAKGAIKRYVTTAKQNNITPTVRGLVEAVAKSQGMGLQPQEVDGVQRWPLTKEVIEASVTSAEPAHAH